MPDLKIRLLLLPIFMVPLYDKPQGTSLRNPEPTVIALIVI
jgi:hypothetical protein